MQQNCFELHATKSLNTIWETIGIQAKDLKIKEPTYKVCHEGIWRSLLQLDIICAHALVFTCMTAYRLAFSQ
jgi:hypothetical protein